MKATTGEQVAAGTVMPIDELMNRHLLGIDPGLIPELDLAQGLTPEANISAAELTGRISPETASALRARVAEIKTQLRDNYATGQVTLEAPPSGIGSDGLKILPTNVTGYAIDMGTLGVWDAGYKAAYNAGNFSIDGLETFNAAIEHNRDLVRQWDAIANREVAYVLGAGIGVGAVVGGGGALAVAAAPGVITFGLTNAARITAGTGIAGEVITGVPLTVPAATGAGVAVLGAVERGTGSVWHATAKSSAARSILESGIDPKFLSAESRFGKGFYAAEQPGTTLAELAHHGVAPTTGIRFNVNQDALRVLDLTDASVARAWSYNGGPISSQTQAIGVNAVNQGYNAIRFTSERAAGTNLVVLRDFNDVLRPVMVTPTRP